MRFEPPGSRRGAGHRSRAELHLVRPDEVPDRSSEGAAGPWRMWASIDRRPRPADASAVETVYCSIGPDIDYPARRGHVVLMQVVVTEDPGGPYQGWLADGADVPSFIERLNPGADRERGTPDAERPTGPGRVVRLAIEPLTDGD